jgi:hypothetical protein
MSRSILISAASWAILYWAALEAVRWTFIGDVARFWATPVWVAAFAAPAAILVSRAGVRWLVAGLAVGVCGSLIWTVHAGLVFQPLAALGQWVSHLTYACAGAGIMARISRRSKKTL